jgi:hypothetical protein
MKDSLRISLDTIKDVSSDIVQYDSLYNLNICLRFFFFHFFSICFRDVNSHH